jgi:hypothetical protein
VCATGSPAETRVIVRGAERIIGSSAADVLKGNGSGVFIEGGPGDDEIHLFRGDIAIGGPGADKFYITTERPAPDEEFTDWYNVWNTSFILEFDAEDTLYVDGVLYAGYTTNAYIVDAPYNAKDWYTEKVPHSNGLVSYAKLGLNQQFSEWIGANSGLQSTGLLELSFVSQTEDGAPRGAQVRLSDYVYGDGGFVFEEKFVDGSYSWPTVNTLTIGSHSGINWDNPSTSINGGSFYAGPYNFFSWDWPYLVEENYIPTNISNYAAVVDHLTMA